MSGSTSGLLVITFFLAEHQIVDDTGRVVGYRRLAEIAETLKPVLLRRGKSEVLHELPERMDKTLFVPMTLPQSQHHEENREIVARIVAKWRRLRFLSEADQRRLMIALQNMRMACDSTYLLDGSTDHGVKADELATLLAEMLEQPDAKVVVFSHWSSGSAGSTASASTAPAASCTSWHRAPSSTGCSISSLSSDPCSRVCWRAARIRFFWAGRS